MSSAPDAAAGFSLEPGPDLREMRDWVHGFADDVIRPAAAEWDEREETPWPILEQAAKIGLYSLDFFSTQWLEPSGLGIPIAFEELFWGDAGIALSLVGSTPGRGRGGQQRHPRAGRRVAAGDVRRRPATSSSARSARPSRTRAATWARSGPGPSTTRPPTSGC